MRIGRIWETVNMLRTDSTFILFAIFILVGLAGIHNANAQNEIHVYSKDIPWSNEAPEEGNDKIYSINEAISQAQTGDEIVIHEGIYREKIVLAKSQLVIRSFEGSYVLISGAELVDGWQDAKGMASGVQVADVSAMKIEPSYTQLFTNGYAQMMARHPTNSIGKMMEPLEEGGGYSLLTEVRKDAGAGANAFATFAVGLPNIDLSEAIFRGLTGKNRNNVFGRVTERNGNTITFKGLNKGQWMNDAAISSTKHKAGWGFIMHKNLIDQPGEWFLEGDELFYIPVENIEAERLEIQVRKKVLEIDDASDIQFIGLNFVAGNVSINTASNLSFEKCTWRYLQPFWLPYNYGDNDTAETGIYMTDCFDTKFIDCYLAHSWGNGFYIGSGNNTEFENCIIEDLGWVGTFSSAIFPTGNTAVKHCTFGDAGRFQLRIKSDLLITVHDSDFYGAMKLGEDAGPIEATSTGSLIALNLQESEFAYNKIHNCHGIPVFDGGYAKQFVVAFYMEDTENYTAHHNLIYNIKSNNYTGPESYTKAGAFLYVGPRYNFMNRPVNYYNNTVWDYDKGINIWHIEAENWEELSMEESGGSMKSGHFENNIFQDGTGYKLNWSKQILNATGGRVDWVSVDNPPSIETTDFDEYVAHCKDQGYHFNSINTIVLSKEDESSNFEDASGGDFRLKTASDAYKAGKVIGGITSTENPDCGALEGSTRVMNAGASLVVPTFLEQMKPEIVPPVITELMEFDERIRLYPNPSKGLITVTMRDEELNNFLYKFHSISGQGIEPKSISHDSSEMVFDISNFPSGIYFLNIYGNPIRILKIIKQ